MHQRAAEADLIIVNHHLFFADLALKQDDFGSILPEYSAVIFDEAHEIEDVASEYFGRQISSYRFEELAATREKHSPADAEAAFAEIRKAIARMRERGTIFSNGFPPREGKISVRTGRARRVSRAAPGKLRRIGRGFEALGSGDWRAVRQTGRAAGYRPALRGTAAGIGVPAGERARRNFVYWFERRGKGVFVAATPIDVSAILREKLFETFDTVVLTSATLAVAGRFEFLKQRLGISAATERVLPPEFDFLEQAVLYIPSAPPGRAPAGIRARGRRKKSSSCWKYRRGGRFVYLPATRRCAISTSE